MGTATASGEHEQRASCPNELGDVHLLARGVGEPDVSGSVVQRGDSAVACIQPQVTAVGSRTELHLSALGREDRAGDLTDQWMSGMDPATGELSTRPGDLDGVVPEPGIPLTCLGDGLRERGAGVLDGLTQLHA